MWQGILWKSLCCLCFFMSVYQLFQGSFAADQEGGKECLDHQTCSTRLNFQKNSGSPNVWHILMMQTEQHDSNAIGSMGPLGNKVGLSLSWLVEKVRPTQYGWLKELGSNGLRSLEHLHLCWNIGFMVRATPQCEYIFCILWLFRLHVPEADRLKIVMLYEQWKRW